MASEAGGGEEKRGRRWRRRLSGAACLPRPGCFTVSAASEEEGTSASGAGEGESKPKPTHLVVTVNGIVGSAENWRFAAKHFIKTHPEDVVVHCSGCNSSTRTFDGVDVMGKRLAEEQIPLLRGSQKLEKMAFRLSWIAGRSGKHLFLKDIEDEKPPLLLQMVTDYGDLRFMFLCLKILGHQHQHFINDGRYPHVVYVEEPKVQDVEFSDAMIYEAKTTSEMEEVMLKGLNRLPWERVDVSFKKSKQKIFAHSTIQLEIIERKSDSNQSVHNMLMGKDKLVVVRGKIHSFKFFVCFQVKSYFLNSDGADVIFHMIDHFLY
ncbi:hypothetical protein PR202_ga13301 [Eleusine coracana subsp. coracana]|uniref:DUF676 domain-containing protein n=1 Tax=Eleusine coracana subsp. coracana TaxID=191504 RepID=A0AAV5CEC4_ELECO|nr:hypothetical protein PR202_ga13301 [Eleusine coracana subsp. coracana]